MKHIIAGGPGCGKTTQVELLEGRGYSVTPEAAREVIKEHGREHPQLGELIYERQLHLEKSPSDFADRSLVDPGIYNQVYGGEPPSTWRDDIVAADYGVVFFLDTLPEQFYKRDTERTETYGEAVALGEALLVGYRKLGFEIVRIPATTPDDRQQRILSELTRLSGLEHELKYVGQEIDFGDFAWQDPRHLLETNYIVSSKNGYERLRRSYDKGADELHFTHTVKSGSGVSRREDERALSQKEFEKRLVEFSYDAKYTKERIEYVPVGDSRTQVCLDHIADIGSFVEIESASPTNVKIWANRLGLLEVVEKNYAELVR